MLESLFDNVAGLCNFIKKRPQHRFFPVNIAKKETLTQVFSFEFCEISKNTFFTGHLRATVSK